MELLRDALERDLFGVVLQKMVLDLERQRVLVRVGDGVPNRQKKRAENIPDLFEGAVGCKKTVAGVEQSPDLRRRRVGRNGRDRREIHIGQKVEADVLRDGLGVEALPVFPGTDQNEVPRLEFDGPHRDAAVHVIERPAENDRQVVITDHASPYVARVHVEMMVVIAQFDRVHSIRSC